MLDNAMMKKVIEAAGSQLQIELKKHGWVLPVKPAELDAIALAIVTRCGIEGLVRENEALFAAVSHPDVHVNMVCSTCPKAHLYLNPKKTGTA